MSLRLRLLLAVGAIAVVALVVADFATYSALRSSLYKQDDQTLAQNPLQVDRFLSDISNGHCPASGAGVFGSGTPDNGAPGGGGGNPNGGNFGFSIPFIEVRTTAGQVLDTCPAHVDGHAYSPQLPNQISGISAQAAGPPAAYFTADATQSDGPAFRVQVTNGKAINQTTGNSRQVLIVVAEPIGNTTSTLHTLFLIELAVTAGALVLALAGGWWLVRLGLRPLEDVERTADAIAAGNLDQRVPGADDTTEVGRLARALNVMLERIEAAFAARLASEARLKESDRHLRQFVADASHELRTPIAAVAAYAELFERGASTNAEDLPRVISGIRTETGRMERLVTDLLELARLDEGLPLQIRATELVGLCAEAVRTATTVGPRWPVTFTAAHPVEVLGDPARLRQVVDNLLANVRAHTPEGTTATVHVDQDGPMARVVVHDNGPGMPAEDAARVFERFYRSDPARGRAHGGTGLGLSIVSAIVFAHGGTVSAESAPGRGMTVTVSLPVVADVLDSEESDAEGSDAEGAHDEEADAEEAHTEGAHTEGSDAVEPDAVEPDGKDVEAVDTEGADAATAARKGTA
ncbi:MAG TPA: HAMP domain-containing sensor histidine kinase [Acidimicrobiales bacterium]|nr:HAMP domain-containing sensor histidine kinase [Acidimicrobiales bacterium]